MKDPYEDAPDVGALVTLLRRRRVADALRNEARLQQVLRTLLLDLDALMRDYSLRRDYGYGHDGDGPEEVGWHDVLQGGRDNYLGNWREARKLAGLDKEEA